MTRSADPPTLPARLTLALAAFAGLVGAAHCWTYRYRLVNLDAVSYLDTADAWRAPGWRAAMNGYWSPLYSWVLAGAAAIFRPSRSAEYALVHAVNLALFLLSFAACALLVRELLRDAGHDTQDGSAMSWSPRQLTTIALVLWTWMALTQLVIWMESPDLLVASATFVAAAMLVRLRRSVRLSDGFLLGAALGCGYLAKAAMLPLSVVYLLAGFAVARRRWTQTLIAGVGLALVSAPWIAALSVVKGRLTMGDAGRMNYIWFVGHSKDYPHLWPRHWPHSDGVGVTGTPSHPDRLLLDKPAVYDLTTSNPFEATYPIWHDPSRWYEGLRPALSVRDELRRLRISTSSVFELLTVNAYQREWMNPELPVLAIVVACWLAAAAGRRWRVHWALLIPGAATIGLYAMVYVSPRYLGAAICVMWVALIAGVRLPRTDASARLLRGATAAVTALLAFAIVSATIWECGAGWRRLLRGDVDEYNNPWHVAEVMHAAGLAEGTRVAVIGNAQIASRWARLARVKIVAEVPIADLPLFAASADSANAVLRALDGSTARYALAEKIPENSLGWRALEGTPYWIIEVPRARTPE